MAGCEARRVRARAEKMTSTAPWRGGRVLPGQRRSGIHGTGSQRHGRRGRVPSPREALQWMQAARRLLATVAPP